jgi:hypothetical protein
VPLKLKIFSASGVDVFNVDEICLSGIHLFVVLLTLTGNIMPGVLQLL